MQHWSSFLLALLKLLVRAKIVVAILFALLLESSWHVHSHCSSRSSKLETPDSPFQHGCTIPDKNGPRANATLLMLAENKDLEEALKAFDSVERNFNW